MNVMIYFWSMQFKVSSTSDIDVQEDERVLLVVSGVSCQDCAVLQPEIVHHWSMWLCVIM